MLQELKSLSSGQAVWKALDKLPDSLPSLYAELLTRCTSRKTSSERKILKKLFACVAFSMCPLAVNEVEHLLLPLAGQDVLRVEEELRGDCVR